MFTPEEWKALKENSNSSIPFPYRDLDKLVDQYDRNGDNEAADYPVVKQIWEICRVHSDRAQRSNFQNPYDAAVVILGVAAQDELAQLQIATGPDNTLPLPKGNRPEAVDPKHFKWGYLGYDAYGPLHNEWKRFLLDKNINIALKVAGFYKWLDDNNKRPPTDPASGFQPYSPYFTESGRQRRLVRFDKGLVKRVKKVPGTVGRWELYSSPREGKDPSIFVVVGGGVFYSSKAHFLKHPQYENQMRHHSALADGEAVEGAGQWKIANGKITQIDQQSGHYQPSWKEMLKVLERLKAKGVDLSNVGMRVFTYYDGRSQNNQPIPDGGTHLHATMVDVPGGAAEYLRSRAEFALKRPKATAQGSAAATPPAPANRVPLDPAYAAGVGNIAPQHPAPSVGVQPDGPAYSAPKIAANPSPGQQAQANDSAEASRLDEAEWE